MQIPSALKIGEKLIDEYPVKECYSKNDILLLIIMACSQYHLEWISSRTNELIKTEKETIGIDLSTINETT